MPINILNKSIGSHLGKRTIIVFGVRLLNAAVVLAISVLLVRILGMRDFGAYASYMAVMALIVLPVTSGIPNLIVKVSAPSFASGELAYIRGVISAILRIIAIYLGLLLIIGSAIYLLKASILPLELLMLLWVHVLFQVLASIRSALLRAAGFIVRGQILERAVQPLLTLIVTGIFFKLLGSKFNLYHAVWALLISHVVTMVWGGIWLNRYALAPGKATKVEIIKIWQEGVHLSGSGLLSSVLVNSVVLLIASFASLEAVGMYRIASAVAQPLMFAHDVLGQVVSPRIAKNWHKLNINSLNKILSAGVLASFVSVVLGSVFLYLIGELALEKFYGLSSVAAYPILMVMALAHCANACGGFDHELLNMSGNSKIVFRVTALLTIMSFLLLIPAVSINGALGAAYVLAIYQTFTTIILSYKSKKITGIDPSILNVFRI